MHAVLLPRQPISDTLMIAPLAIEFIDVGNAWVSLFLGGLFWLSSYLFSIFRFVPWFPWKLMLKRPSQIPLGYYLFSRVACSLQELNLHWHIWISVSYYKHLPGELSSAYRPLRILLQRLQKVVGFWGFTSLPRATTLHLDVQLEYRYLQYSVIIRDGRIKQSSMSPLI